MRLALLPLPVCFASSLGLQARYFFPKLKDYYYSTTTTAAATATSSWQLQVLAGERSLVVAKGHCGSGAAHGGGAFTSAGPWPPVHNPLPQGLDACAMFALVPWFMLHGMSQHTHQPICT